MKMMTHFMGFLKDVEDNKKLTYLKTKSNFIDTIRNTTVFTAEEIMDYTWIIEYGKNKFHGQVIMPEGFKCKNRSSVCEIIYTNYNTFGFTVTIQTSPSDNDVDIIIDNITSKSFASPNDIGVDSDNKDIVKVFKILKEFFVYSIELIMDKIIKGDDND